ncbi:hypothetical protein OV090_12660 [Nannocystis sp. RBIL2]|uniref:hypothetical protein n=1 Tax=Nannocystis sp. RBIL2 TaxID=2996788 RepID=UPI00226FDF4D|nr:hypothetical protein [Nannocystis sp. RBIL2]MCY1065624.1 hypothetical protein [Nannocystis sp. RBIL2]
MHFGLTNVRGGRYNLGALVMVRGEHCVEVIEPGEALAFIVVRGQILITRQRAGEPATFKLVATPRAPILVVNPGTYTVVAEQNTLGLRGARHARM